MVLRACCRPCAMFLFSANIAFFPPWTWKNKFWEMWAHQMKLKTSFFAALFPHFLTPSNNGMLSYESQPAGRFAFFSFFFFWRSCAKISWVPLKWLFRFEAMVAIEVSLLVRGCLGLAVWSWNFFCAWQFVFNSRPTPFSHSFELRPEVHCSPLHFVLDEGGGH